MARYKDGLNESLTSTSRWFKDHGYGRDTDRTTHISYPDEIRVIHIDGDAEREREIEAAERNREFNRAVLSTIFNFWFVLPYETLKNKGHNIRVGHIISIVAVIAVLYYGVTSYLNPSNASDIIWVFLIFGFSAVGAAIKVMIKG